MLGWAAYGMLALLGVVMGVVGAFEHSAYLGLDVPVAAVGWLVLLFAAVHGPGRLMGARPAALTPGIGWMLVSTVFAVDRSEGDLVIAANPAGYLYLFGGFAVVALAVLLVPTRGPSWLLRDYRTWPGPSGDARSSDETR